MREKMFTKRFTIKFEYLISKTQTRFTGFVIKLNTYA